MELNNKALIYGANGYSADLIIAELIKIGLRPILAGRHEEEIKRSAAKYNCEYKIFSLIDHKNIVSHLEDIHTVLNCAGPSALQPNI